MLGWITDAIRRWRRQRSRAVFRFFDGRRTRAVDPYDIHRGLQTHPTFKWTDLQDANREDTPDDIRAEAIDRTIQAVRDVFGLATPDEGGLLATEVTDLLESYALWVEDSKKKSPLISISSPRAAGRHSVSQEGQFSTTALSSASS